MQVYFSLTVVLTPDGAGSSLVCILVCRCQLGCCPGSHPSMLEQNGMHGSFGRQTVEFWLLVCRGGGVDVRSYNTAREVCDVSSPQRSNPP